MIEFKFIKSTKAPAIDESAVVYYFEPVADAYFFTSFKVTTARNSIYIDVNLKSGADAYQKGQTLCTKLQQKKLFFNNYFASISIFSGEKSDEDICRVLNTISEVQDEPVSLESVEEIYKQCDLSLPQSLKVEFQSQQQKLFKQTDIPLPPKNVLPQVGKFKSNSNISNTNDSATLQSTDWQLAEKIHEDQSTRCVFSSKQPSFPFKVIIHLEQDGKNFSMGIQTGSYINKRGRHPISSFEDKLDYELNDRPWGKVSQASRQFIIDTVHSIVENAKTNDNVEVGPGTVCAM